MDATVATTIVHTFLTTDTYPDAQTFSTMLAVNKGVTSEIVTVPDGHVVIASDGKAIKFQQA
jgi:hypothetical protein